MTTPVSRRGSLTVSERVVSKIASQVVSEVGGVYGTSGGFLGIGSHPDSDARPRVDVALSDSFMDLRISVGVAYPTSVRGATARIRDEVKRRVADMTGIAVHRVDIDVAFLRTSGPDSRTSDREALR